MKEELQAELDKYRNRGIETTDKDSLRQEIADILFDAMVRTQRGELVQSILLSHQILTLIRERTKGTLLSDEEIAGAVMHDTRNGQFYYPSDVTPKDRIIAQAQLDAVIREISE